MSYTLLLTAPYMMPFVDKFKPVFDYYKIDLIIPPVNERMEEADLLSYAGEFDATICGDDRYTPKVINACTPRLKVISKWGTGIDSIDKEACKANDVMIGNTPNAFTHPVADSIMGYILAFARKQPWMDSAMKNGDWKKISGHSLQEVTVGLIGFGNIGKAVAKRALGFDMKCIATDIIDIPKNVSESLNVTIVAEEKLLLQSDYICLTCDLNSTSKHIINQQSLSKMKENVVVIPLLKNSIAMFMGRSLVN